MADNHSYALNNQIYKVFDKNFISIRAVWSMFC